MINVNVSLSTQQRKNLCYKNLLSLTSDFLNSFDYLRIEKFEKQRAALIRVLQALDLDPPSVTDGALLNENRILISKILELDQKIFQKLQTAKDETLQKLQEIQTGMKGLQGYKSPQAEIEQSMGHGILDVET